MEDQWTPILSESAPNYAATNWPIAKNIGIQSGTDNTNLPSKCVDLTPFVRQAQLPEIKPANADQIQTLFGVTSAGAFSPYASDGQQQITLQVVDTEFSILDSLFYPWMKDINSPWWYRPDRAYTEWATPYPMATLEVQRPRMRYSEYPEAKESRNQGEYTYYSYKYIGVKPTNYASFEVQGGGVNNLLRSLSLTCDMCLVDLKGDVAGSSSDSTNLGNRTKFIFTQMPGLGSQGDDDDSPGFDEADKQAEEEEEDFYDEEERMRERMEELDEEIEQQDEGDMPGEDEDEWMDRDDPYYDEDEYADPYGDEEGQDVDMPEDDYEDFDEGGDETDYSDYDDQSEDWESDYSDEDGMVDDYGDPNGDLDDYGIENDESLGDEYSDADLTDEVNDDMMDVGDDIDDECYDPEGWLADDPADGYESSFMDDAMGMAKDAASATAEFVGDALSTGAEMAGNLVSGVADVASKGLELTTGLASDLMGSAGDLAAKVADAGGGLLGTAMGAATGLADTGMGAIGNVLTGKDGNGGLLGPVQKALGGALGGGGTMFGTAQNVLSGMGATRANGQSGFSTMVGGTMLKCLSSSYPEAGKMVGQAANMMGGTLPLIGNVNQPNPGVDTVTQQLIAGGLQQIERSKDMVGKSATMANVLNGAAYGIAGQMGPLGNMAQAMMGVPGGPGATTAALIQRTMTTTTAKPTPIETYTSMVTKQKATGMAQIIGGLI